MKSKNFYDDNEFLSIIQDIIDNKTVQEMKHFRQHYNVSCFDHCLSVSYHNYLICKRLNLDYVSAARAGMLHDLFLYDWRYRQEDRKGLHAFTHPHTALENSEKLFKLNKREKDIIVKHMWPLTVLPPKYPESFLTTLVDKYCTLYEAVNAHKREHITE